MKPSEYTNEYIIQNADNIDWTIVCLSVSLNLLSELSDDYSDMYDWFCLSSRMDLTVSFIRKHSDKLHWGNVSYYSNIEVMYSLVDEFSNKMSLSEISMRADFTYDLMEKIVNKQTNIT